MVALASRFGLEDFCKTAILVNTVQHSVFTHEKNTVWDGVLENAF
jgi:hypothetical protein